MEFSTWSPAIVQELHWFQIPGPVSRIFAKIDCYAASAVAGIWRRHTASAVNVEIRSGDEAVGGVSWVASTYPAKRRSPRGVADAITRKEMRQLRVAVLMRIIRRRTAIRECIIGHHIITNVATDYVDLVKIVPSVSITLTQSGVEPPIPRNVRFLNVSRSAVLIIAGPVGEYVADQLPAAFRIVPPGVPVSPSAADR